MRPVTEAPASWPGVASTVSPSTTRTGVRVTSSPTDAPRRSTLTTWPCSTRSCLPPLLITAYIGLLPLGAPDLGRADGTDEPTLPPSGPSIRRQEVRVD